MIRARGDEGKDRGSEEGMDRNMRGRRACVCVCSGMYVWITRLIGD